MALSTKNLGNASSEAPKGKSKREKVQELLIHHKEILELEGVSNPKFIPRLCYKHKGELIIGFYKIEIEGGVDIYTEFCDRNFVPEDPKRTLYKWYYNPEYADEYELSDPHPSTGDRRYLIPIEELVNLNEVYETNLKKENTTEGIQTDLFDTLPDPGSDIPYKAMTLRDYAAIQWKRPVSQKKWLNELISNEFKEK